MVNYVQKHNPPTEGAVSGLGGGVACTVDKLDLGVIQPWNLSYIYHNHTSKANFDKLFNFSVAYFSISDTWARSVTWWVLIDDAFKMKRQSLEFYTRNIVEVLLVLLASLVWVSSDICWLCFFGAIFFLAWFTYTYIFQPLLCMMSPVTRVLMILFFEFFLSYRQLMM